MLRKTLFKKFTALLILLSMLAWSCPARAAQNLQWTDLVTSVVGGVAKTTRVYGYFMDLSIGRVFVVCNPQTGQESGACYITTGSVGKTQQLDHYDTKQIIDWDHPQKINPALLSFFAPNIPSGASWYDSEHETLKGDYRFQWPMDYGFCRCVPGSDPDYWLIIAEITNPNNVAVQANFASVIDEWNAGYATGYGNSSISKSYSGISLQPFETKYFMLNRGKKAKFLGDGGSPGYTDARYTTSITQAGDETYPNPFPGYYDLHHMHGTGGYEYFPLVPMRLVYVFRCSCYYGSNSSNTDPTKGGWPTVKGTAKYVSDGATGGTWSFTVTDWLGNSGQTQTWKQKVSDNINATLPSLFSSWFPGIPTWEDEYPSHPVTAGSKTVTFYYLYPVPPADAPPGTWGEYTLGVWAGWEYTTDGAWSDEDFIYAPQVVGWPWTDVWEANTTHVYVGGSGGDFAKGAYILRDDTSASWYDPRWMDNLPVLVASPCFTDKYTFTSVSGDQGYLSKQTVPGYVLSVDTVDRPVLTVISQPVTVQVSCTAPDGKKTWSWTGSGWQLQSSASTPKTSKNSTWSVAISFNQNVSGKNPSSISGTFKSSFGGGPAVCSPSTLKLDDALNGLSTSVQSVSVDDAWINTPAAVTLGPKSNIQIASASKQASATFSISGQSGKTWDQIRQQVLNNISNTVMPLVSSTDEAVFQNNTIFKLNPDFQTGAGGVICGAQKDLIYGKYKTDGTLYGMGWGPIGFGDSAAWTNYSYFNRYSPTGWGLMVRAGDEVMGQALRCNANQIQLNKNLELSSRLWRFVDSTGALCPGDDYREE